MIPRIVHTVWPGADVFERRGARLAEWRASWAMRHPDWTFLFHRLEHRADARVQQVLDRDDLSPVVKRTARRGSPSWTRARCGRWSRAWCRCRRRRFRRRYAGWASCPVSPPQTRGERGAMPESANEHLDALERIVRDDAPSTILDVGMGRGNYGWFLRVRCKWTGRLTGIEVWAPYVAGPDALAGGNRDYYQRIIVADVRESEAAIAALSPDLVFAFDVVEHMPMREGAAALAMLRRHARSVLVSVPLVAYPQGPLHGNPYEAHQHDWTEAEMVAEGGELLGKGAATGLFKFRGSAA